MAAQKRISAADVTRFIQARCLTIPAGTVEDMVNDAREQGNTDGTLSLRDLVRACGYRKERVVVVGACGSSCGG